MNVGAAPEAEIRRGDLFFQGDSTPGSRQEGGAPAGDEDEEAIPGTTAWFHCASNPRPLAGEPTGPASDGEVEDYQVTIAAQSLVLWPGWNLIALPRQVCMYLARSLTRHSLEEIGGHLGGRDHSTVVHACSKIEQMYKADADFRSRIDKLTGWIMQTNG